MATRTRSLGPGPGLSCDGRSGDKKMTASHDSRSADQTLTAKVGARMDGAASSTDAAHRCALSGAANCQQRLTDRFVATHLAYAAADRKPVAASLAEFAGPPFCRVLDRVPPACRPD